MPDTVKRAIVILPRFEGLDRIEQFRRRYDPLASRIAPHITLVFPFESDLSADQLCAHMQQVIQGLGGNSRQPGQPGGRPMRIARPN